MCAGAALKVEGRAGNEWKSDQHRAPLSFTCHSTWNLDVHHNKGREFLPSRYRITQIAQSEELWRMCKSPGCLRLLLWMYMEGSSHADWLSHCVLTSNSFNCFGSLQMYRTDRRSLDVPKLFPDWYTSTHQGPERSPAWSLKAWRSQLGPAANTKPSVHQSLLLSFLVLPRCLLIHILYI